MSYSSVIAGLSGVVGHWLLDETSGTTAAAAIGPAGTYTGSPTLNVTSPSGLTPGISVSGGSRVVLPASSNWDFGSGDFWVAFWFKTSSGAGSFVVLGNTAVGKWVQIDNGSVGTNVIGSFLSTSAVYNNNAWHLCVLTRVSGTLSIYMDGATSATVSQSVSGTAKFGDASNTTGFGANADGNYAYVGSIDGLAIGKGSGLSGSDSAAIYAAGTAAGSFTLSPTSVTVSTTGNSITLTGTGTSWTSGTPGSPTFTLSGGTGASITAQSVASTTSATITVTAGSATGTLTITDPSTGATQSLTVAAAAATAFALSGPSSGTVNTASTNFTFTPNGNYTGTITPSMSTLSGSWSPSSLTWSGDASAKTATYTPTTTGTGNANGTGSPSLTQPSDVAYTSNTGPLTAGSLTLTSSSPSGPVLTISNGTGGVPTLTHYLHRSSTGKGFTPSGTTAGSGTCIAVNPSSPYTDSTLSQGNGAWYVLRTTDATPTDADSSYLAATTYSAAIRLGGIGDSRMASNTSISGISDILTRNGWSRTTATSNMAVSGSSTSSWLPGQTNYVNAVAAFNSAGTNRVIIDLGTNDAFGAISSSTYQTRIASILAGLWSDVATLQVVYLSYQTQMLPTDPSYYSATLGYNATLRSYQPVIDALAAADPTRVKVIGKSIYGLSASVPSFMASDGLHESSTGITAKTYIWANDIIADLSGSGSTTAIGISRGRLVNAGA